MSAISLAEGSMFADRYRIVRRMAAGGMGAIYEVIHLETDRRRALKVMHPHLLQSDELRERFRQEAKVASYIESEFIVDVFDAGIDTTTQMPFLVMELLRGDEIGKLLKKQGRFSPAEVVTYLHQAALALDKTHRAMIVHRDLKPENLFLTWSEDGAPRIKVLDFGIAKMLAEGGTNATSSIGTPLYMAPEQFRPGQKISSATDLYALGMMAYTLLVGKAYWSEEARADKNVFAFAGVVMNGPQEPGTERAQRAGAILPAAFDSWFARATALEPDHRFCSAIALVAGLADALGVQEPRSTLSSAHEATRTPSHPEELHTSQRTGEHVTPSSPAKKDGSGAPAGKALGEAASPEGATAVLTTSDMLTPVVITHGNAGAMPMVARGHKGLVAGLGVGMAGLLAVGLAAFFVIPSKAPTTAMAATIPTIAAAAPVPPPVDTSTDVAAGAEVPPVVPPAVSEAVTAAPAPKAPAGTKPQPPRQLEPLKNSKYCRDGKYCRD